MAITITQQPTGRIHPTSNPIVWKAKTDCKLLAVGTYAQLVINAGFGIPIADMHIIINGIRIDFINNPDPCACNEADRTVVANVGALRNLLRTFRDLFANYSIVSGGGNITITALEKGSEYDLTFFSSNLAAVGLVLNVPASDQEYKANHKFLADIYSGADKLITIEAASDNTGESTFCFEKILATYLSCTLPIYGTSILTAANNNMMRYRPRFYEQYNLDTGETIVCGNQPGGNRRAWIGGYSYDYWPQEQSIAPFATNLDRLFATNRPDEVCVTETQQHFLTLYTNSVSGSLTIFGIITANDGTEHAYSEVVSFVGNNRWVHIPVGLTETYFRGGLPPSAPNPEDVCLYTVQAAYTKGNSDVVTSEVRTFNVCCCTKQHRHFLFCNSLGGWDSLLANGQFEKLAEIEQQISKLIKPESYADEPTEIQGQYAKCNVSHQITHKANTGWNSKEDNDWLLELFTSKHVVMQTETQWIPVVVTAKKVKLHQDNEDLYNIEFSFVLAYDEQATGLRKPLL